MSQPLGLFLLAVTWLISMAPVTRAGRGARRAMPRSRIVRWQRVLPHALLGEEDDEEKDGGEGGRKDGGEDVRGLVNTKRPSKSPRPRRMAAASSLAARQEHAAAVASPPGPMKSCEKSRPPPLFLLLPSSSGVSLPAFAVR